MYIFTAFTTFTAAFLKKEVAEQKKTMHGTLSLSAALILPVYGKKLHKPYKICSYAIWSYAAYIS